MKTGDLGQAVGWMFWGHFEGVICTKRMSNVKGCKHEETKFSSQDWEQIRIHYYHQYFNTIVVNVIGKEKETVSKIGKEERKYHYL